MINHKPSVLDLLHTKPRARILRYRQVLVGLTFTFLFAGMGTYLLITTHAATLSASIEAESGALTGAATIGHDASASNGSFVQFGATSTIDFDTSFVTAKGTNFMISNGIFRPTGVDIYNAAGETGKYSCGPTFTDTDLDSAFNTLHTAGVGVVRFWAFESYTAGGTDWSQIDRVVAEAHKYHMKLIPVLENQWQDCTAADFTKTSSWYSSGYKSPYGGYPSYRDYVQAIVTHYKKEPAIMAWMLMNEAEGTNSSLVSFATDVSGLIKSIDPNHLVTLGTLADGGQQGTDDNADDYARLYGISTIDFAEAHDYGDDTEAMPGGTPLPDPTTCQSSIACALSISVKRLHKPFLIGEAGIETSTSQSSQQRATLFDAKINAMWQNGGAGYLIWQYSVGGPNDSNDAYKFTAGDPLLAILHKYGSPLN